MIAKGMYPIAVIWLEIVCQTFVKYGVFIIYIITLKTRFMPVLVPSSTLKE